MQRVLHQWHAGHAPYDQDGIDLIPGQAGGVQSHATSLNRLIHEVFDEPISHLTRQALIQMDRRSSRR